MHLPKKHKTNTNFLAIAVILSLFIVIQPLAGVQSAQTLQQDAFQSTDQSLRFSVQVPWQELSLEANDVPEQDFTRISLPGWEQTAQPGSPELPHTTRLVGVPFGMDISLEITPGRAHHYNLPAPVLPVHTQTIEWLFPKDGISETMIPVVTTQFEADPQVYQSSRPYPGVLAEVANDGELRGMRIISIAAYPVQYDPSQSRLTVYESLDIFVKFDGEVITHRFEPYTDGNVYEEILSEMLLNYEDARHWRQTESPSLDSEANSISTDTAVSLSTAQAWTPPVESWRIKVQEAGLYQLTYAELEAAGVLAGSPNPAYFQMFYQGNEIPIEIRGGIGGVFNNGDLIIFYGQAIDNKYTQDNMYWLTVGDSPGLRINTRDGTPNSSETPGFYQAKFHFEENISHWSLMPGSDSLERFYWKFIGSTNPGVPASWDYNFNLFSPKTDQPSELTIAMVGFTSHAAVFPDHRVTVHLNGNLLGETTWDGRTWRILTLAIPPGTLNTGNNTLKVTVPNDTGAPNDAILVDWIKLAFANQFQVQNDQLFFDFEPGAWKFTVNGFSSNQVSVYDITNATAPVRIEGVQITSSPPYSIQFSDLSESKRSFLAAGSTAFLSVQAIQADDNPSDLFSPNHGADYIIISHTDFLSQAETLRSHRATQGLRTKLVDVQDVYDTFAYGVADANAIHSFLAYTYTNWQPPAPSYVLLIGDGHYDPKDFLDYGRTSYIPPYLAYVDPGLGETAADNRYVTLEGTNRMPDMMLGRLPVNSLAEAEVMVNKIIAYETAGPAPWYGHFLAVADNADSAGDFPAVSDDLMARYLPAHYTLSRAYLGQEPTTTPALTRQAIINGINAGTLFVNYFGHAADTVWAHENIFSTADIPSLNNSTQWPVILAMTCLEGFFHNPDAAPAFAVAMTRAAGKGSIANWSPSGLGVATGHNFLNSGFLWSFFQRGAPTLGEPIISGKLQLWASGAAQDLLDTYHLFGDPALQVRRILTAIPDFYQTTENIDLSIPVPGVLANDINPSGSAMTAALVQTTSNGTTTLQPNGAFTYQPNPNWYGVDTFTYKISAGDEESNTVEVRITVNRDNNPPTDILLSSNEVEENQPPYTVVGTFTTVDPDVGDTFTYKFVAGEGDTHNHLYNISGSNLRTRYTFNHEALPQHSIRVRSTDSGGLYIEKQLTIYVLDVNEPPYYSWLSNDTVSEDAEIGSIVGEFSTYDEDVGDEHTYALVDGTNYPDNAAFSISGNQLLTNKLFNYSVQSSYTILVRTTDLGGLYCEDEFIITVIPAGGLVNFEIPLLSGWNLVSFNLQPQDTAPDQVLSSIAGSYSLVYAWDATTEAWLLYDPSGQFLSDLETLDKTMGFWLLMDSENTLVVRGTVPETSTSITLQPGWNLLGYPSGVLRSLPNALTGFGVTGLEYVLAYDPAESHLWELFDPAAPPYAVDLTQMTPGRGYWVKVSELSTWVLPYADETP